MPSTLDAGDVVTLCYSTDNKTFVAAQPAKQLTVAPTLDITSVEPSYVMQDATSVTLTLNGDFPPSPINTTLGLSKSSTCGAASMLTTQDANVVTGTVCYIFVMPIFLYYCIDRCKAFTFSFHSLQHLITGD